MTRSVIPLVGSFALQVGSALAAGPASITPDAGIQVPPAADTGVTGFVGTLDPTLTTVCLVSLALHTFHF
jgi:hypothetical protein